MGVRGIDELVAVLPPAAAGSARAVAQGLADLASLRHSALAPEDVRALGELWERFTAQVGSGRLAVLAAMDARDDVIPKAKVGDAGAVFAHHVLGQRRGTARRDGRWASLLRPEVGDLPEIGAAFAAGDITTAHVEVAVRAHRDLGGQAREALVDCQIPEAGSDDSAAVERAEQLRTALAGLSNAFTARVRQILVVDVLLAHYARLHAVPELDAIAARIVRTLNPPDPKGAHERRFLFMSQLPDGAWRGRFECGSEQGLRIKRALAAFSAPRPGKAIDADGVEHQIPDERDLGARQIDAVTDIMNVALAKSGLTVPDASTPDRDANRSSSRNPLPPRSGVDPENRREASADPSADPDEPPPAEGEEVVVRESGVLYAPYPSVEMVLVAGIQHVAAAWAHRPEGLALNLGENARSWLRDRFTPRLRPREQSPEEFSPAGESPPGESPSVESSRGESPPGRDAPRQDAAGESAAAEDHGDDSRSHCACQSSGADLAWLGRALSPYGVPARVEQAGFVDADTLQLLACSASVRAALLAPNGALLDLGRTQRLASPAQKTALLARDGGCVIPGCTVPGDACDAHHVIWWEELGPTDLDNLALVCGRHHTEVHQRTWEICISDGIPWVRPPSWMNRGRPRLRNAAHHPGPGAGPVRDGNG